MDPDAGPQQPADTAALGRLRAALAHAPAIIAVLKGPDLRIELASGPGRDDGVAASLVGRTAAEVVATDAQLEPYLEMLRRALETGEPVHGWEAPARLPGAEQETYWDFAIVPLRENGDVDGVLLHAVDVTRLVEARRRAEGAEHRFTTLFQSSVVGVTISEEQRLIEANDAFLELIGRTRKEFEAGLKWSDLTAPEWADADARAVASLHATGVTRAYEKEYLRPDGSRVPVLISGARLQARPLRVLVTLFDLSDRKAVEREISSLLEREREARLAAEVAGARMTRLQEITGGLSAATSAAVIGRTVVQYAIEDVSASAGMLVRTETGGLRLQHAAGFARGRVDEWRQFPTMLPGAATQAISDRSPVFLDPEDAQAQLGVASAVALPLVAGDRALGALILGFRAERTLGADEQDFLSALTHQAAAALDRARLYENRAYVARKLQEGLLPQRLADVPRAETAVVYESISGGGEVGGDFYDVFKAGPGRWAVAVGDVCGKGTEAAVITGLARHTVRAVARLQDDPAMMLSFLNAALRAHAGPPAFCTVACALLEGADGGGFTVRLSSGGHPPPLIVRTSGAVEEVGVWGTMLGVSEDPTLTEADVHLAPGDALVMYTDGVVDAREQGGERFGEARMLAALERTAGGTAGAQAAAVEAAVRAHAPGPPVDDRAIVVLRALPDR